MYILFVILHQRWNFITIHKVRIIRPGSYRSGIINFPCSWFVNTLVIRHNCSQFFYNALWLLVDLYLSKNKTKRALVNHPLPPNLTSNLSILPVIRSVPLFTSLRGKSWPITELAAEIIGLALGKVTSRCPVVWDLLAFPLSYSKKEKKSMVWRE